MTRVSEKTWQPPKPHVAIVGGGLAGLATAAALVDRGLRLTLLESRPRLGGRACSFPDPVTGELVDNCQHVTLGCCTNLADFARRVGIRDLFVREPVTTFLSPEGRLSTMKAGLWPAPLHFTGSFLRANYLSWADKGRIARGMLALVTGSAARPGESFGDWLLRHGQNVRTINRFWGMVLVSALNERPEHVDVGHARKLFLDGFLRTRDGFVMEVPRVPLGELYGSRLQRWLEMHGVAVRLKTGVRTVALDVDGGLVGVTLRNDEALAADFVVLAVPFGRVLELLPDAARRQLPDLAASVAQIAPSPITGVHLWFDRPVCPHRHVALVGRLSQWVFNHTALQGRTDGGQYLQVVISASHDLQSLDRTAIRDAVLADLAEIWPEARAAKLIRDWVVTEHEATFSVRPGIERLRPDQRTALDGLFLAGDWTATGWPATMEGAVRSGYRAAEEVSADLGRPRRFVRPDLPTGVLARLLLGPPVRFDTARSTPARPEVRLITS